MILKSLSLRNFRKFKSADIEFPDGIVGIIGLNGVGKSTIFEAVAWALYGPVAARTSIDEIKRVGAKSSEPCKVELDFSFENNNYKITRVVNNKSSTATIMVNGKVAAEGSDAVNRYVQKLLGMDYKSFFTSVYAKQKELNVLSTMRPHERRPLILGMLGINAIDEVIKNIRSDVSTKKQILEKLKVELLDKDGKPKIDFLKKEKEELEEEKKRFFEEKVKVEKLLRDQKKQLSFLEKQYNEQKKNYENMSKSREELEKLKELYLKKKNLEDKIAEAEKKIRERESRIKIEEEKIKKYQNLANEIKQVEDKIEKIQLELNNTIKEIKEKETLKMYKEKEITEIEKKRKDIEKLGPNAKCPTCERVLEDHYYNLLDKLAKKTDGYKEEISSLLREINEKEEKQNLIKKELEALQRRNKHLSEEMRTLDKIKTTIDNISEEIELEKRDLDENKKMLAEIKHISFDEDRYKKINIETKKAYEAYQSVLKEYNEKKDKVNKLELDLERLEGNKRLIEQKIKSLEEQIDNLKQIKRRIEDETLDLEYLELLVDVMSSFRTDLISRIRPMLSTYASDFFERLTDGKYKIIELDEDYNIEIYDNGKPYDIKRFSGGEEDLANLCLRLAISETVSERADRQFNFIILDEIFGSQDNIRRQNIMQALNALSSKFRQIFLITHIEDVKNLMENVIHVIEDENGISYVKVE
jgi:exonuclease SbcC